MFDIGRVRLHENRPAAPISAGRAVLAR